MVRGRRVSQFQIKAEPHVTIRLKRIFGKVQADRAGAILLSSTPENCRELEWVLDRWAMTMSKEAREMIKRGAEKYVDGREAIYKILGGEKLRDLGNEPVRVAWEHQQVASDIVLTTGGLLIGDELGLGKSLAALLALRNPAALPALVVTMTHLPRQWEDELRFAYPWMRPHILQGTRPYDISKARGMKGHHPDVIITNYHKLDGWAETLSGQIRTVIFDECQELRHTGSGKYVAAARIADGAAYKIGLSATPVFNYGGEMFNILDVLFPGRLGTPAEFQREWCHTAPNGKVMVEDPAAFGTYLRDEGFFLRRTRKEVGQELPEALRIPYVVDSDAGPLDAMADEIAALAETVARRDHDDPSALFKASGQLDMRLRQATGIAKAKHVADHCKLILETEKKIVLAGWHRDVYSVWLRQLGGYDPVMYTGSESPRQKLQSVDRFINGDARILIMSLRSGSGLNGLQEACRAVVFGELDWSPAVHEQLLGRLRRGEHTDDPVLAYFMVSNAGSDPVIAQMLNIKRMQAEPMRDPDRALIEPTPAIQADRMREMALDYLRRHRPNSDALPTELGVKRAEKSLRKR